MISERRYVLPPRGSHRLRIGRRSAEGACYFVTTKSDRRQPILTKPGMADTLADSIRWMESSKRWSWLCYVIMPDHLHLVFILGNAGSLARVVHSYKRYTAERGNKLEHRKGNLWQDGYFDHRLRTNEKLEQVAFYCFRNPVLAGLVKDGREWPYFGCKPELWERVQVRFDELLALEAKRKGWSPPS